MALSHPRPLDLAAHAAKRRSRSRPSQAETDADLVFTHIPAVGHDPSSGAALAVETGLSIPRIQRAVAYLRDNYPDFPLVSSPQGYCFTVDLAQVSRFWEARAKAAITLMRRGWTGAFKPYLEHAHAENPALRRAIERNMNHLFEAMTDAMR